MTETWVSWNKQNKKLSFLLRNGEILLYQSKVNNAEIDQMNTLSKKSSQSLRGLATD
jgi:hypothetical protein